MERYKNLGGNSSILEYEIGPNYIDVKYKGGRIYRYSYVSSGPKHVQNMIQLAKIGCGLNSYITKNVKNKYERKF